jgi:hypothetical protein
VSKAVEEQDFFEYFLFFAMKNKKTAEKQKRSHSGRPGTLIPGKKETIAGEKPCFPGFCGNPLVGIPVDMV